MDRDPFVPSERALDRKEKARNVKEEQKQEFAEEKAELARRQHPPQKIDPDPKSRIARDMADEGRRAREAEKEAAEEDR